MLGVEATYPVIEKMTLIPVSVIPRSLMNACKKAHFWSTGAGVAFALIAVWAGNAETWRS
jgi:hypothetical protein